MEVGLHHLHSGLRYLLLILLIVAVVNAFMKWRSNAPYENLDNQLSLVPFILAHLQLLIGFVLWGLFMSRIDHSEMMSNNVLRFYAVEHLIGMLLGIGLITIGRIKAKKALEAAAKHKTTFVYYLIGLLIIVLSIPWPFRGLGNAWF